MSSVISTLLELINGYKTYGSVILAIATGLGLILSKDYGRAITDILQAALLVFSGASVASVRHAVAKATVRS